MKPTAFIIILGILISASSCQKRARVASLPPAPPPSVSASPVPPPPVPPPPAAPPRAPAPSISPAMGTLTAAERAFENGNYAQAARSYESYLRMADSMERRDEALFRLGLIFGSSEPATRDWTRASNFLKELIEGFPRSPLKPQASLILNLFSELNQLTTASLQREQRMKQLTTELENLKKIDAQRRKKN